MDEVEAVARSIDPDGWKAHDKAISSGIPLFTRNAATFVGASLKQARAAIAALDEYRTSPQRAIDYIARSPHIQEAIRKAKSEPPIEWGDDGVSAFAQGREAGLREAAAVAYRSPAYVTGFDPDELGRLKPGSPYDRGRYDASNEILALIDAGKTPDPAQPEPGAASSSGTPGQE